LSRGRYRYVRLSGVPDGHRFMHVLSRDDSDRDRERPGGAAGWLARRPDDDQE
jgi:hypothetical protein